MQSGSRCSNRPSLACIHRLVPLAVRLAIRPTDIRRQWNVPDPADRRLEIDIVTMKADRPTAVETLLEYLAVNDEAIALESDVRSRLQLLPRMHQRFPFLGTPNSQLLA